MTMDTIEQAVILAGGLGTRLRPLTDDRAKPMITVGGKPFLEHIIADLANQGIQRILLLLGYKSDSVMDYFGDGRSFGVSITYSVTNVEDMTGRRLKRALPLLDKHFLLMYCDNYCPLSIQLLWNAYQSRNIQGQLCVYANEDGYTRNNVSVTEDMYVAQYDKTRTAPGLAGVDIGYAVFNRNCIERLTNRNVMFESAVYQGLVAAHSLGAYVTRHRYYSIGSLERLETTDSFFTGRPVVILDRDGVLNRRAPKAQYITIANDFEWLPGSLEALRILKESGYRVAVITNQAGIARGIMSEDDLAAIHGRMRREALESGGSIDAVFHCPHGWDDGCSCRKPAPGMLYDVQHAFDIDLRKTVFIGDDERDEIAGKAAGCITMLVSESYPLIKAVKDLMANGRMN